MLGVERYKVTLVPHNNNWENEYQFAKNELITIMGDNIVNISHVGSTAIKGLLLFCRYMNQYPEHAKQYNDWKLELALKYPDDRAAYGAAKTAFIEHIVVLAKNDIKKT